MYGIISGKTLPTKFKIKVNPYQSVALQEHLFSIGGEWFSGCKLIQNIDAPFIFFENGKIEYDKYEWGEVEFGSSLLQEIKFEDFFEPITSPTSTAYKLKKLLEGMTQEEFGKEWEEIKNLRLLGPTIEEYLKSK